MGFLVPILVGAEEGNTKLTESEIQQRFNEINQKYETGKEFNSEDTAFVKKYGDVNLTEQSQEIQPFAEKQSFYETGSYGSSAYAHFDGVPNMKPNEKVILFGANGDLNVLDEAYYGVVGAHQGKFNIIKGKALRYASGHNKDYPSLETPIDEIDQKIKEKLASKRK
ncbi:hypothetical protein BN1058_00137 [Paraliobacillus sp. PM-2]|uniref:hypothetical protein n=1 Tax=Paraliobacillus sp. PM-2 TaxID=1462524 RepID=UPI00061BF7EC|nr:hypothetical protein [Paraliobacillus sp. PM-2]CQR45896.1 hypothetical protein BN1058_00137 [Paraliobacillus sp. PM-2]